MSLNGHENLYRRVPLFHISRILSFSPIFIGDKNFGVEKSLSLQIQIKKIL